MARAPTFEVLTAYVDGKLDPALHEKVAAWLCSHPEAAAEIEGHRGLAQLWQASTPAKPDDSSWAPVLAQVEAIFFRSRARQVQRRRRIGRSIAGLAAALLLVLLWPYGDRSAKDHEDAEPLAVVAPEDVEIVSLRAADRATLVVGVLPVSGPLVLVSAGDVEFERIEPDADGMIPSIQRDEGASLLVWAPLDGATERAPDSLRK